MRTKYVNPYFSAHYEYLSAHLVESVRLDGKPRQKTVAYLSSIKSQSLPMDAQRLNFWERVASRLATLDLTPEVQKQLIEQLEKRVPPVSEEQIAYFANLREERRLRNEKK